MGTILNIIYHILTYVMFLFTLLFVVLIIYLFYFHYFSKPVIFFSYSHHDKKIANKIIDILRKFRLKFWIDLNLSIPSNKIEVVLDKNVSKSDVFVILSSKYSLNSDWVKFELINATKSKQLFRKLKSFEGVNISKRNFFIVILDDNGLELYNELLEAVEPLAKDYEAKYLKDGYKDDKVEKYFYKLSKYFFGKDIFEENFFKRQYYTTIDKIDLREQNCELSFNKNIKQLGKLLEICSRRITILNRKFIKVFLLFLLLFFLIGLDVLIEGCILRNLTIIDIIFK